VNEHVARMNRKLSFLPLGGMGALRAEWGDA
jgi:hypothetical protein